MIRTIAKRESGVTLIELLVAMSLMTIVLGATLTSFERFYAHSRKNEKTNDQQQTVRESEDRLVRQLRNLANPTSGAQTIAYADATKLIFQTTDPSKQWVSYCLDFSTPSNEVLYYQTAAPVSGNVPGTTNCPVDGAVGNPWAKQVVIVDHVVNQTTTSIRGATVPLFTYSSRNGVITPPVGGGSVVNTSTITRVGAHVILDTAPGKSPDELTIDSGAYMRNQNQAPTARFKGARNGANFSFDGSASSDPEGRNLKYDWYSETGTPAPNDIPSDASVLPDCSLSPLPAAVTIGSKSWKCLGGGIILTTPLTPPINVWLRVTDAGTIADLSGMPPGGCNTAADTSPVRNVTDCQAMTATG